MLLAKPDSPINKLSLTVMREINNLAQELGFSYFLCGAMARDILLQHVHGIQTGRATVDVDFGVAVEDWAQFEKIKISLTATGRFDHDQKVAHRLYYRYNTNSQGYPVDLIPFGGVETTNHQIEWPPSMDEVMNVIAYQEVLANSVKIEVEKDLVISVISLPGLALLKLFAWADRGNSNSKDALDLAILLRTYYEADNQNRLFGEESKLFEEVGFDFDAASPRLLGKDVRRLAYAETLKRAMAILNDERMLDRLTTHMIPGHRRSDDAVAAVQRLLEQFKAGLSGS
ncbi:MAG: hypothetical protein RL020_1450 [Pseudomonadota bacterium]|jgi:predicted nucleotidyltransferase